MNLAEPLAAPDTISLRDAILTRTALHIIVECMTHPGPHIPSSDVAKQFLRAHLGGQPTELFCVMYLDGRHHMIAYQHSGSPRDVLKEALMRNAASVLVAHNHPDGSCNPTEAELLLNTQLKQALDVVGVQLLDHVVVTAAAVHSCAEHGEL